LLGAAAATATVMEADCDSTGELLSLTVTVKLDDPVAAAVPEMVLAADDNERPVGKPPEEIAHVYGAVPPVACRVCTKAAPTVRERCVGDRIDNGGVATVEVDGATTTAVVADVVCAGPLLSVTIAVKVTVPVVVGTPEIVPVAGTSASPAGSLPDLIAHE